jgi:hypothetical protein
MLTKSQEPVKIKHEENTKDEYVNKVSVQTVSVFIFLPKLL